MNKIISIDGQLKVKTREEKKKDMMIELMASCNCGKILTGTIAGVEKIGKKGPSVAVVFMDDYKILIPAAECIDIPPAGDKDPIVYEQYLLSKRLASEIDFVVKAVEEGSDIVAASRMEAMLRKRKEFLLDTDEDGEYFVKEGSIVEARVVATTRAGIIVEIFGAECYIPCRELSYQRIQDATQDFYVGTRVLVKILSITRDMENSLVDIDASVKQASENPYDTALAFYNEGDKYVGTVSMIDHNGVFVALDSGIDVLCRLPDRGPRPPRGATVTIRITLKNEDEKRLFGLITHMARI